MKQWYTTCLVLLLSACGIAKGQELRWIEHLIAGGGNFASYVDVDKDGTYYITGYFGGSFSLGSQTLNGSGPGDIFIAKFGPSRQLRWVKQGTSAGWDAGRGVAVDGDGNVFVSGYFQEQAGFDGVTVNAVAGDDGFVAKYSKEGVVQWVRSQGGTGGDWTNTVCADAEGNSYAVGYFNGGASFGTTSLASNGAEDIFIVSYAPDGTLRWVKNAGGSGSDFGYGVKADADGNVYVTGQFVGSASFSGQTINGAGASTGFMAKYDTDGTLKWVKGLAGTSNAENLSIDTQGKIYIVGAFTGTATFGSQTLNSAGAEDIYVVKYDADGTALAAWRVGGSGRDGVAGFGQSSQVIARPDGGFFLASSFENTVTANGKSVQSAGNKDILLARFDPNGGALWMMSGGGTDFDGFIGLGVDSANNSYLFGNYFSSVFNLGTTQLPRFGGFSDMFLAKIDGFVPDGLPHIALSKSELNIGDVVTGNSKTASLSINSSGSVPLTVSDIYFDDPQSGSKGFEIVSPAPDLLPATLDASQPLGLTIRFSPPAQGSVQTKLVIESNDPAAQKTEVVVRGTGLDGSSLPRVVLSATELNIGDVWLGTQREGSLTVSPANGAGLVIESIDFEDPGSIDDGFDIVSPTNFPITLQGGEELQVKVAFIPPDAGAAAARLVIITNDEAKPFTKVNVTAVGTEAPVAEVSRSAVDFGVVDVAATKRESLIVRPGSSGKLQVNDIRLQAGGAGAFGIVSPAPGTTYPVQLNPGQELTVTAEFAPTESGEVHAVLIVETNDPISSIREITLSGTGTSVSGVGDDADSESGSKFVRVIPNPILSMGEVRVRAPRSGPMTIALMDLSGKHVSSLFQGRYEGGIGTIPLDARPLAAGVYICVVDVDGDRYYRLVMVGR